MLSVIFGAIPVILSILSGSGVIPQTATTLTANLLAPVETLIANLKSGTSKTQDALAALAALSGVIAVLKSQPNLPADLLTQINNVDQDVQAALKAYGQAANGYDISLYQPIAAV